MSNQGQGSNLKECKDCKANGVTTMVLWMANPANPAKRMPADYKTLLETGQHVPHRCPYWKKTGTAPATVAPATVSQAYASGTNNQGEGRVVAPNWGQSTLPFARPNIVGADNKLFLAVDEETANIMRQTVLALQEVADKLGDTNEYLQILANREVKANPGIKSALQAKNEMPFDPQWCDHDQEGTINDETGICTNCGTSFPVFIKKKEEEQEEFPDEDQLDEVPQNRRQRDPDAFPPI